MAHRLLHVWLRGEPFGELERLRDGGARLRFSPEVVDRYGFGSHPLSLSLPVGPRRIEGPVLNRFLENLLPESALRSQLEREHGIRPGDAFGLLAIIGAECAGAVQFTVTDTPPSGTLRPLTPLEVDRIVSELPTLVPPDGLPITASLGGIQAKVLLARTADGWSWPADGAVSTHLIKPEPLADASNTGINGLVRYEAWTMRLARLAGIAVATVELASFADRDALIVERYDRHDGQRIHQEDFAQSLGLSTAEKYEVSGEGPGRLADVIRIAASEARDPDVMRTDLLRLVAFNAMIGNGDAHAKNYSFLIDDSGQYSVAPLYDAAPVFLISSRYRHSGFAVNGTNRLDYISREHLVSEAVSWGMAREEAGEVVSQVRDAIASVLEIHSVRGLPIDLRPALVQRLQEF